MSGSQNLVDRFRRWVVGALAFGALLYVGGSIWVGFDEVGAALANFAWWAVPVLAALTLANYVLRFFKWHYYMGLLGVAMPFWEDFWTFIAGLSMAISPGKAGELLKPYVVRARTGTPMATTIPALVSERLTDGIAMLILAGMSVTTYAADKVHYLTIPAVIIALGLAVMAHRGLSMALLGVLAKMPVVGRLAPKLGEMYSATRVCLAPVPLAVSLALSLVAWMCECVGYWLVFKGLGVADASLDVSVFLYAFATVAGAAMPGGLGVSDGALAAGAVTLMGLEQPLAVASALLVRVVTLWMGVGIGALALIRVSSMLGGDIDLSKKPSDTGDKPAPVT